MSLQVTEGGKAERRAPPASGVPRTGKVNGSEAGAGESLEQIAARGVELHPSDRDKATAYFVRQLEGLPALQHEANQRLGRLLVNEVTRALHFAKMRRSLPSVAAQVRENLGGIMKSWNIRGKLLRDATRMDIEVELHALRSVIAGVQIKVVFLETLLSRLVSDSETVGERFSEEEVAEAFAAAEQSKGSRP